ncbi:MAG TPA: Hpt domain-containing protein [Opitutaceae bacterium]|nr:Hpt domain-containing protein [Opitutaceae bacterium]HRJ45815.1 Hpt domain-containing protein [Opitutaceae bacterium]
MSLPPVIDPQALDNLRALNPGDNDEFLRELAAIFLEDTPKRITELDASLAAGDSGIFTRAAHSIKGSAANLGAMRLRAAADKLEHYSRKEGLTAVDEMVAAIKAEFTQAAAELKRLIGNG